MTYQELVQQSEELNKCIRRMVLTIDALDADYYLAGEHWRTDKKNRQFWSRVVIRCLCANIEARLYVFRGAALEIANAVKASSFTKDELEILTETRVVVVGGMQQTKSKWLPIKDSLKESLRLFAKSVGISFNADCGTKGYQDLCDTFEVRHRLMHPKNVFALEVRDEAIRGAESGIEWFGQQCTNCLDQCKAHTSATLAKEREILAQKEKGG